MEFENILKGLQEAIDKAYEAKKEDSKPACEEVEKDWVAAYQQVKDENEKIKEAAKKLLEDFDKVNTSLRDALKENQELRAKLASVSDLDNDRKRYYNEVTTLRKERTSYAKAIGTIYGALENLNKELNA